MPITIDQAQNELTSLQYSVDQILLNKMEVDYRYESNTPRTEHYHKDEEGDAKTFSEMDKQSQKDRENNEEEIILGSIEEVRRLYNNITDQLDDYLELFSPTQQSDFHYMLDALQTFGEWSDDYSKKLQSLEIGNISDKQIDEFRVSSEFVSVCSNWLGATVSTVLKYGFSKE